MKTRKAGEDVKPQAKTLEDRFKAAHPAVRLETVEACSKFSASLREEHSQNRAKQERARKDEFETQTELTRLEADRLRAREPAQRLYIEYRALEEKFQVEDKKVRQLTIRCDEVSKRLAWCKKAYQETVFKTKSGEDYISYVEKVRQQPEGEAKKREQRHREVQARKLTKAPQPSSAAAASSPPPSRDGSKRPSSSSSSSSSSSDDSSSSSGPVKSRTRPSQRSTSVVEGSAAPTATSVSVPAHLLAEVQQLLKDKEAAQVQKAKPADDEPERRQTAPPKRRILTKLSAKGKVKKVSGTASEDKPPRPSKLTRQNRVTKASEDAPAVDAQQADFAGHNPKQASEGKGTKQNKEAAAIEELSAPSEDISGGYAVSASDL